MQEQYNLPVIRENSFFSSIKKIFQGMFNIRRRKRDQKRKSIMAQRAMQKKNVATDHVEMQETHKKVGTNMVKLGTKYLRDIGMKDANLSYTYSGLDVLYGASGYEISTYYFMGEKLL